MVRNTSGLALVAAAVIFHAAALPAAENIFRKREKPVSGDVTAVSKTDVSVKVKTPREETIKIPANDVQSINWTGEAPEANLARGDETGGRYQRALDNYQKALSTGKSSNPLAKIELEFAMARTRGKAGLADQTRLDEGIKSLEEFRTKNSDHYRYYDAVALLGQLYLAKKEFVKAQLAFDTLAKAPWKEAQLASKTATGRLLIAENKTDEALAAFDAVIAETAEGKVEESQRQEAMLGKVRVLMTQRKFDEAQKLLEQIIRDAAEDDVRVQAEANIRLGDCLREQGQDKPALLAYLHVDLLFPAEKPLHAEALFHLARLFDKVGEKGRAAEAREKLESEEFKGSEWARALKAPAAE